MTRDKWFKLRDAFCGSSVKDKIKEVSVAFWC